MHTSAHADAIALLGNGAAFIPIAHGSKSPPKGHDWKNLSLADTQQPAYLTTLDRAPAIAALLGPVSSDLVAIDFDCNEAAESFMALNPALSATLRTHGRRGCVLWLRMEGKYPASAVPFKKPPNHKLGEWRAGSCYSIIAGHHMDGGQYTVLIDAPPMTLQFGEIHWPPEWQNTPTLAANDQNAMQRSIQKNVTGSACPSAWQLGEEGNRLNGSKPDQKELLERLFERFIDRFWSPAPEQRNEFIVKSIPFLFHAVSPDTALRLVMLYHQRNRSLFKDSAKKHETEARAHLRNVAARFETILTPDEKAKYASLRNERERAAFRICRHLSKHESIHDDCEGNQFFLSYEDLGNRLLTDPKSAQRLMKRLIRLGIVEIVRNGQRRLPGIRGRATVWRYLL